jgi:3-dehydroquinate dehydratase
MFQTALIVIVWSTNEKPVSLVIVLGIGAFSKTSVHLRAALASNSSNSTYDYH